MQKGTIQNKRNTAQLEEYYIRHAGSWKEGHTPSAVLRHPVYCIKTGFDAAVQYQMFLLFTDSTDLFIDGNLVKLYANDSTTLKVNKNSTFRVDNCETDVCNIKN